MQIRVHKNAAYFAISPAYFGYVRVAFFYFLAAFFQGTEYSTKIVKSTS